MSTGFSFSKTALRATVLLGVLAAVPASADPAAPEDTPVVGAERSSLDNLERDPLAVVAQRDLTTRLRGALLGNLPLRFESNQGQTGSSARFVARGNGYAILLDSTEVVLILGKFPAHPKSSRRTEAAPGVDPQAGGKSRDVAPVRLTLQFVGANPAPRMMGHERLPGESHYLVGSDPERWRTGYPAMLVSSTRTSIPA